MIEAHFSIHELERDLGPAARLHVVLNAGGQRRYIPELDRVETSKLSDELGIEITLWLAARFGGEYITFPSRRGQEDEQRASLLRVAVMEAGLTGEHRSANSIAAEFGVTLRRIRQIRAELRVEAISGPYLPPLPLFDQN